VLDTRQEGSDAVSNRILRGIRISGSSGRSFDGDWIPRHGRLPARLLHATIRTCCAFGTCYLLVRGHTMLAAIVLGFGLSWVRE